MYEAIHDWLCEEAKKRNIDAKIYTQLAKQEGKWVHIPVHVAGEGLDAFDVASRLQDLEDSWNDREPRPDLMLVLRPAAQ